MRPNGDVDRVLSAKRESDMVCSSTAPAAGRGPS